MTVGFLVAAVVLLAAFVMIQRRAAQPLLPLRVVLDRNRAGAFFAMFASAVGMFGVFRFLTYYLQVSQHYSAVQTGVAFLPMVGVMIVSSTVVSTQLANRVSPRILIPVGMLMAAIGMWIPTGLSLQSTYVSHTLPTTLILGAGLGIVFALAMSMATLGVHREDAGVASAAVNTVQQVGGSIGTALLNTLAAVHCYVVAFWWSAGIFAVAALLVAPLLRAGVLTGAVTERPVVA